MADKSCYPAAMAAPLDPSLFKPALIVLGAAAVVIPVFHRLKLSPVLGFMLVGMAVGPFGAGRLVGQVPWLGMVSMTDDDAIAPIAELGVIMLMFMIGLEMSFQRLKVMRRFVFGFGPLQMLLCTTAIGAVLVALGLAPVPAIILALALAISSTAVVIQVLADGKRLSGRLGRASLGVLLFQDLAAVPILFVVGLMGGDGPSADVQPGGAGWVGLVLTLGKAVAAVVGILLLGRLALRPLFRSVARTGSPDLFVAACLLVVLGTSVGAAAAGLTPALGALVAGLMLAETEYRRQVEVTIEPFKGLLLGVFLISVGMSLDINRIVADPWPVLAASLGLVVIKVAITTGLGWAFGLHWPTALHAALLLGPGGEFGFVIIGLGVAGGLIDPPVAALALIVVALGMAAIPALGALGGSLARWMAPAVVPPAHALPEAVPDDGAPRVIVAGFGRVGQTVASLLEAHCIAFIAIDTDPDSVAAQRKRGRNVYWGDITQPELLHRLHLETARALVVTMADARAADALVANARAARPDLLIVARARDARHAAHLYAIGATDAVPETIEASLQLSESVLVDMGIPMGPVIASIHEQRSLAQAEIRAMAPAATIRPIGRRRLRDALPKL